MSKDATKNKDPHIDANVVFLSKIRRAKHASNKGRSSTLKAIANGTTKSDHKVNTTKNDSSGNATKKGGATMPVNKSIQLQIGCLKFKYKPMAQKWGCCIIHLK